LFLLPLTHFSIFDQAHPYLITFHFFILFSRYLQGTLVYQFVHQMGALTAAKLSAAKLSVAADAVPSSYHTALFGIPQAVPAQL
jgi:hypothetical protein